jgi:hypothetical protein
VFVLIELDVYRNNMKRRSPRWNTVYLPARQFRSAAVSLADWMDRQSDTVVTEMNLNM